MDSSRGRGLSISRIFKNHLAAGVLRWRMRCRIAAAALIFVAAIGACQAAAGNAAPFRLEEKPGRYGVGLKVVEQYDYSRVFAPRIDAMGLPYQGERARPLQTLIWYPGVKSGRRTMTFGDYMALEPTESSFGRPLKATALWAVRDAQPVQGRFPVIIYAPSFSSVSWENADLCEYLASFGYVVVAGPAMGVGRESTHDVAGTNEQARDISFLIGYAGSLPDTDLSEVAVVGYSWGGLANLFAASRDDRIDGLVALDGSMRGFPGVVKEAGDVHPGQMTIPLLFFEGQHSIEDEDRLEAAFHDPGPNVLNKWVHGDLIAVSMLGLVHPEFSSRAQRNEAIWRDEFAGLQEADYGREDGVIGYAWVARYTRAFLDAHLKHDAKAEQFLKNTPAENEVPSHVMAVHYRRAESMSASFGSFRVEVGRAGFQHAREVYVTTRKQQPGFALTPDTVTDWAYELLAEGHTPEAIDIMKLAIELEPSSRNYASMGEMDANAGRPEVARESYEKALELDPNNRAAKQGLERVNGQVQP
jgi:pimeloyl-ACP methyl ester carboxylesterase